MLHFILLFAIILILSSIAINGFYNITRGRWVAKPDNTKEWVGKIFSFWGKFLQRHTVKESFYSGNELLKQLSILREFFDDGDFISMSEFDIIVRKMDYPKFMLFKAFAATKEIKYSISPLSNDRQEIVPICKTKMYVLPNFIRAPFGECLACMSSVFGVTLFTIWHKVASLINAKYSVPEITAFLSLPFYMDAILCGIFCISLAYLNEMIFNINYKLGK